MVQRLAVLALVLVVLLVACGDDGATDASMDTGAGDSGPDTTVADSAVPDGAAPDGAAPDGSDDAAADASADAGTTSLVITEFGATAFGECAAPVPTDPLQIDLFLEFDNSAAATEVTATLTSATLTFDDAAMMTTVIALDPAVFTLGAGDVVRQMLENVPGTPPASICDVCAAGRMVDYVLVFDVDGVPLRVEGTVAFGCTT